MSKKTHLLVIFFIFLLPVFLNASDDKQRPVTNKARLLELSKTFSERFTASRPQKYFDLVNSRSEAQLRLNINPDIQLMFLRENSFPVYNAVENINAARTISTDDVWPGGSTSFGAPALFAISVGIAEG